MTRWISRLLTPPKFSSRNAGQVLSMNQRNLSYIYAHNRRRDFPLADDKLRTKELMIKAGVPVPKTFASFCNFFELNRLEQALDEHREFVIKPAQGRGGGGIIVIVDRTPRHWIGINGTRYTLEEFKKHLADIIFGVYSLDRQDVAVIEERICQHPTMTRYSPYGLADIRVILFHDQPVLAMSRIPTRESGGRANIHQGALGVGIDLETGRMTHAVCKGRPRRHHPDSEERLVGGTIPHWDEVVRLSRRAAEALPMKYLGVDISLTENGPVLLEVNVRPGLEIQNANKGGLRPLLEAIHNG